MVVRCEWATEEPNLSYHDKEWGRPEHDDQKLFEFLILEGAQAGLSWVTILKRRKGYRKAFSNFDAKKVTKYNQKQIDKLPVKGKSPPICMVPVKEEPVSKIV